KSEKDYISVAQPHFDKNSKYLCSYCPRVFTNNSQLRVHTYLHTGERPYSCNYCGDKFIRRDYLQRHFLKCTKKEQHNKVPCDTCNGFFTSDQLETHKISCISNPTPKSSAVSLQPSPGSPPKGFPCAYCSFRFLLFSQLQEHYIAAHKVETMDPTVVAAPLQHHLSKMMKIKEEPLEDSYNKPLSDPPHIGSKVEKRKDLTPLSCPECNMKFINRAGLSGHLRVHKKEVPFRLLYLHQRKCKSETNSQDKTAWQMETPLKAHIDFALNDSPTHFKDDSNSSGSWQNISGPDSLEGNKSQSNPGIEKKAVQYQCSECEKTFTDGLMLISHLEDHGREEQAKRHNTCHKCKRVFASSAYLEKHMKMHEEMKDDSISCPECPKQFSTLSELEEHKPCHDPSRSFACKLCHLRFRTKISLCDHLESHVSGFKCPVCFQCFATATELICHFPAHSECSLDSSVPKNKPRTVGQLPNDNHLISAAKYECSECGHSFLGTDAFRQHSCSHQKSTANSSPLAKTPKVTRCHPPGEEEEVDVTGEDFYHCPICSMQFSSKSSLLDHQNKKHSLGKTFKCKICGKFFSLRRYLRKHELRHEQAKTKNTNKPADKFKCTQCSAEFSTSSELSLHKRFHAEKEVGKHRCDMCYKSFSQLSLLWQHQESHVGQIVYECNECDKAFAFPHLLEEHQHRHLRLCGFWPRGVVTLSGGQGAPLSNRNPKPTFSCYVCGRNFNRKDNMMTHRARCQLKHSVTNVDATTQPVTCESHPLLIRFQQQPQQQPPQSAHQPPQDQTSKAELPSNPVKKQQRAACTRCGNTFATRCSLRRHLSWNRCKGLRMTNPSTNPPKTYHCSHCNSNFPNATSLLFHQRSGKNTYTCGKCGQSFMTKSSLICHHNTHVVDRVSGCIGCGLLLSSKKLFIIHQRIHTGERPFKCLECGKGFSKNSNLNLHLKTHRKNDAQETCAVCDITIPCAEYSSHMKLHAPDHQILWSPPVLKAAQQNTTTQPFRKKSRKWEITHLCGVSNRVK
uniref:C2H2-type domain-containing protein n=1 Tax=Takifugu rubripes TaxID=31033 RepID=A0A674NJH3_TAKRU